MFLLKILEKIHHILNIDLLLTAGRCRSCGERTTNLGSNLTLISYLNEFPLFGSKYLDYRNWEEILNQFNPRSSPAAPLAVRSGEKYSIQPYGPYGRGVNIDNVLSLKSEMNDKRTVFTWNHLNKFYNLDY